MDTTITGSPALLTHCPHSLIVGNSPPTVRRLLLSSLQCQTNRIPMVFRVYALHSLIIGILLLGFIHIQWHRQNIKKKHSILNLGLSQIVYGISKLGLPFQNIYYFQHWSNNNSHAAFDITIFSFVKDAFIGLVTAESI